MGKINLLWDTIHMILMQQTAASQVSYLLLPAVTDAQSAEKDSIYFNWKRSGKTARKVEGSAIMRSMSCQMTKKFKYSLVVLIFIIIFAIMFKLENKSCKENGLEREEAVANADKRLSYFAKNYEFKNMKLQSSGKSDHDKSWTFSYIDDAKCEVMVDVDSCGATDISGFSAPCLLSKK